MIEYLPNAVQLFLVFMTALSASGLFVAFYTRRALRSRDAEMASVVIESEKIDHHSVALQSLRFELEAAKVEMEKRRLVLVTQEATIRQQRQDLLEAQRMLAVHEATIIQLSKWAEWVTRILDEKGIEAPPPPIPIATVLPVSPPSGTPKE